MAKQTINIGTVAGDGTGDPLRTAFTKANDNFTELYDGKQPLDDQLTSLAALAFSSNGSKVVRVNSGATAFELHTLAKADVGLGNVDDTADASKPVSTATQTALDAKQGLDATLTALAALDGSVGVLEQTGADAFAKRAIGIGASTSLLTRADGDARFAPIAFMDCVMITCTDDSTAITTTGVKATFRMPYAMTLTEVRASLTTAETTAAIITVDLLEGGSSILSTQITIDSTEKTSKTAAVPAVIADSAIADDAEIQVNVTVAGTDAKGLKIYLLGTR